MRLAFGLAIALWLGILETQSAFARQDASWTTPPTQVPGDTKPAPESAPAEPIVPPVPPASSAPAAVEVKSPSIKRARKRRKKAAQTPPGAPRKIVVREGGATAPAAQIVPGIPPEEAARERENAENWLASADGQLQRLAGRSLDVMQQETVAQVHNYMGGARSALREGDVGRASTLAQKARLLLEDLLKH